MYLWVPLGELPDIRDAHSNWCNRARMGVQLNRNGLGVLISDRGDVSPATEEHRAWAMTVDEYFAGYSESKQIFDAVATAIASIGEASVRPSKSQVAFRRRKNFAIAWVPAKYLKPPVAPLVLTLSFPTRVASKRWKQVSAVAPRRFTHHLELHQPSEVDAEVRSWLRRAWQDA
jgi:hypothetical protein